MSTEVIDHQFQPSKRSDSCDFTDWQEDGPWLVCDMPRAAHPCTDRGGRDGDMRANKERVAALDKATEVQGS